MDTHTEKLPRAARALAVGVLGAAVLHGCRPTPSTSRAVSPTASREIVISDSEITRLNARTAWEAVRLRVPKLVYGLNAYGRPTGVRIEELRSYMADQTPLLVVDGARVGDIMYLDDIPGPEIQRIRVLDGDAGQVLYGLAGSSGVIIVETKRAS